MPWFKVDDKLHEHPKAHRAGIEAIGLWTLAGSYCGDNPNDGFVPERVLVRWIPTPAKGRRLAQRLVEAELWHPDTQDGEAGWRFHDWGDFQPTRAQIAEERRKKAEAGRKGGLSSGRSRREASAKADASQSVKPPSRPDPNPSVVTQVSHLKAVPRGLDNDGLTRIRQALNNCPEAHARKCADFVLAKAPGDVRNPVGYILAAIADEPDAYRYRRGNPKKHQECPTHAGQWADACAGCAADRKASA